MEHVTQRRIMQVIRSRERGKKHRPGGLGSGKCSVATGGTRKAKQSINTLFNQTLGVARGFGRLVAIVQRPEFDSIATHTIFRIQRIEADFGAIHISQTNLVGRPGERDGLAQNQLAGRLGSLRPAGRACQ